MTDGALTKSADEKFCQECGSVIRLNAEIRPKCGVRQHAAASAKGAVAPNGKSRLAAALFALLLGGIGGHTFYLGKVGQGIVFLLFCWPFIPALIASIETIILLTMSDESLAQKHSGA
jgi:TM2 domain-containing membrane protein YozV